MLVIKVQMDSKKLQQMYADAAKQVPFAKARALTAVAKKVQQAELAALPSLLDRPKPFTSSAIRVESAKKTNLTARVFMMDKTAWYLDPYEFGGKTKLNPGAKSQSTPINQELDGFGNIKRGTVGRLKNKPDFFIGDVKTKKGIVYGLWQRPFYRPKKQKKGMSKRRITKATNTTGKLILKVRFLRPHEATQRINYRMRAAKVIHANFQDIFDEEFKKAFASRR